MVNQGQLQSQIHYLKVIQQLQEEELCMLGNANFTVTGSTFYDNETTGIDNSDGGAAFDVAGSGSTNSITNCTFYQNTTARANQDYGTIRTENGNTTVTNSLFYDNKTRY